MFNSKPKSKFKSTANFSARKLLIASLLIIATNSFSEDDSQNKFEMCQTFSMMGQLLMVQRQAGSSMSDSIMATKESMNVLFDWSPPHDAIMHIAVEAWAIDVGPIDQAAFTAEMYRDILFESCASEFFK